MRSLQYDVVVCGAGVAGAAAAIASARRGAKTVLIEKQCLIGGLATSGLIYIYLPLCDGEGRQITRGISEEMIRRCVEYGPFDLPEKWGGPAGGNPGISGDRFRCCFSPAGFTLTLDKMLKEAGVDLWLDTLVTGACTEKGLVTAVEADNLSGRIRIEGKCFVDASGCSILARLAGAEYRSAEAENPAVPGVISEINYVTPWMMEMGEDPSFFHLTESLHVRAFGKTDTEEFAMRPEYDGKKVTEFVRRTWQMMREYYDGFSHEERKKNYPVHLPAMPQIRKIARIDALCNLTDADAGKHFEHSVGVAADWHQPFPGWETPYEALIPKALDGLLAAGRCIGAGGYAWEMFRVIPAAAMTGEAAGAAAALCAARGLVPKELPYPVLKESLEKFYR